MPKPFANSAQITYSLVNGDWLLGIQTGNSTGDAGLPQMKHIKLSQLSDWVRGTYGQIWRYRGGFSASLPSDAQANDYFLATATFTVDSVTYTKDHLYAYNASGTWDDISDVLSQYASQAQVTDIDDRLTVVEVKVDAMGDGIVYKGEVATYADLAGIVDPQTGWEYYVTADAAFYIYNGASWDQIDNGIVQTITDGDTAHAPSGDAVYDALASEASARESEDSNLKSALTAVDHRLDNLEQPKGGYVVTNYKDGSITPSGKGDWAVVEGLRGVSRVENRILPLTCRSVTSSGVTITYDSDTHKFTLSDTATADALVWIISLDDVAVVGHRYLVGNTSNKVKIYAYFGNTNYEGQYVLSAPAVASGNYIGISLENGKTYNETIDISISDMNVYFGGTIPSDADTIAEIQQNYPHLLTPSEYGTRIVDSSYSGVRAEGNLIDESSYGLISEISRYGLVADVDEGFFTLSGTAGQSYATGLYVNGNLTDIENVSGTFSRTFNISEPCKLMIWINSSTNYLSNVMLNRGMVANPHCAYMPTQTLSLSYSGKSAGSVYDSCEPNVEVGGVAKKRTTQRIESEDFSTLDWTFPISNRARTNSLSSVLKPPVDTTSLGNYLTEKGYTQVPASASLSQEGEYAVLPNDGAILFYYNGTLPSGLFYYELKTPVVTLSDPLIDNTLLTEAYGRMSTVQTGTVVDGSFDMGFITL